MSTRIEHDSMGEVEVPADALWGAQTQRAVDNFPVSGERIGRDLIGALGSIKDAAARVNGELGVLDVGDRRLVMQVTRVSAASARELASRIRHALTSGELPSATPTLP